MNVYPVLVNNRLNVFRGGNSVALEECLYAEFGSPTAYVSGNTIVVQYSNGCRDEYYFNDAGLPDGHQFFG